MSMPPFLPASPSTGTVIPDTQIVSLHTVSGTQLYQFLGNDLISLTWSRETSTPSRCELEVSSSLDYNWLPDIVPWLHWISVWDETGQDLYWSGPIQKTTATRESLSISAKDMSALFSRTRCPLTKRWDVAWPVDVAAELLAPLIELHGLGVEVAKQPLHPLQYDERYDFQCQADGTLVDAVFDDLVNLGLRWTVVSGTPVLGPLPRTAVASLTENDFVGGGLTVVRDGSDTYNDVVLRGADTLAAAAVPMGGLHLQTTVSIDDMFGVSNVDRAVKQYAAYTAQIRDTVTLPDNAVLHPYAPVHISQLIPSARFVVDAYGLLIKAELTGIDVTYSSTTSSVAVRLTSVDDDLPELVVLNNRGSISGIGG